MTLQYQGPPLYYTPLSTGTASSPTLEGTEVCTQIAVVLDLASRVATFRQTITVINDKHSDVLVVGEVGEKFRRDQEVLPTVFGARHLNELVVHSSLVLDVHTLSVGSADQHMAWSVT